MTDLKELKDRHQELTTPTDRTRLRERVRAMIRAEVDKFDPTEDARRPLELIVESALRYGETHHGMSVKVVDKAGHPRTRTVGDRVVPFTVHDLLEELRRTRPMLFKPALNPDSPPLSPEAADAAAPIKEVPPREADGSMPPYVGRKRDWLDVGSEVAPETSAASPRLIRLQRGNVRLHLRSRTLTGGQIRPLARPAALQDIEEDSSGTFDPTVGIFGGIPDTPRRGRGLTLAAVTALALLAVGGLVFLGRGGFDGSTDPGTTGAVSSQNAKSISSAAFRARTLRGVPDVLDTATLSLEGEVVRLFGVEWAPGGGKPEDLMKYLRGREVVCKSAGTSETYRCQVEGQDLSRVVLYNGGGKATAEATEDLKAAEEKARASRIGVWSQ